MDDQLGLSELITSQIGKEKQIMAGDEEMFHFAMRIDELEELLEVEDTYSLFWINSHIKEEAVADFLKELEENYMEAQAMYDEGPMDGFDRYFMDGMQYVYCYLKNLKINAQNRKDAIRYFMVGLRKNKLGRLIVAYAIGYLEVALEEQANDAEKDENTPE
jgi:hypothetical protein